MACALAVVMLSEAVIVSSDICCLCAMSVHAKIVKTVHRSEINVTCLEYVLRQTIQVIKKILVIVDLRRKLFTT